MLFALAGLAFGASVACPAGPTWTRERQQRAPILEPAPVVSVQLERDGVGVDPLPGGRWLLDPERRYALVCSYADASESRVLISGQRSVRVSR